MVKLRKYEQKFDHIVLDTNVLVAGIINPFGNPAKVLNLVLNDELIINADTRILSEYERVLKSQKFFFPKDHINVLLQFIFHQCCLIVPNPLRVDLVDEDDLPFIEVALQENIPFITGNKKHFKSIENFKIYSPSEFLSDLS